MQIYGRLSVIAMNFIENESAKKLRGGYYTPPDLAGFIARWVGENDPQMILEPSCGDGAFLAALSSNSSTAESSVMAFELDLKEARSASRCAKRLGLSAKVNASDFLEWAFCQLASGKKHHFDAVVGNPPFIRYQYLPAEFQAQAQRIFHQLDCKFTKHSNAWVPFVLASIALLRPAGRLGMVVPSEILHIIHAQSLRSFLGTECSRLVIIDPEQIWFQNTLQGSVILLAEKRATPNQKLEGLGIIPVRDREFTKKDPAELFTAPQTISGRTIEGKWTKTLLDNHTRDLLYELGDHPDIHRFQDIAEVDVGIVTGANKYFFITDEEVERYRLGKYVVPMFGRSDHCPGVIYDEEQHKANSRKGNPTNFVWFEDASVERDRAVRTYLKIGEEENLHTRYKCRIRTPWYSVPSVYSTEIGMLKRAHDAPRLVHNEIGAYTTDTAYRIRSRSIKPEQLVANFFNPLTALSAELEGRHYGGGVLEMVPSEIERLMIPLANKKLRDLQQLNRDIKDKPACDVLAIYGCRILSEIGLSKVKQKQLMAGWRKLRDRRKRVSSGPRSREES